MDVRCSSKAETDSEVLVTTTGSFVVEGEVAVVAEVEVAVVVAEVAVVVAEVEVPVTVLAELEEITVVSVVMVGGLSAKII